MHIITEERFHVITAHAYLTFKDNKKTVGDDNQVLAYLNYGTLELHFTEACCEFMKAEIKTYIHEQGYIAGKEIYIYGLDKTITLGTRQAA